MEPEQKNELNEALLNADAPPSPSDDGEPKRNSKSSLIQKIIEISEREGIPRSTPIQN